MSLCPVIIKIWTANTTWLPRRLHHWLHSPPHLQRLQRGAHVVQRSSDGRAWWSRRWRQLGDRRPSVKLEEVGQHRSTSSLSIALHFSAAHDSCREFKSLPCSAPPAPSGTHKNRHVTVFFGGISRRIHTHTRLGGAPGCYFYEHEVICGQDSPF